MGRGTSTALIEPSGKVFFSIPINKSSTYPKKATAEAVMIVPAMITKVSPFVLLPV
jgi:hypothetical protein